MATLKTLQTLSLSFQELGSRTLLDELDEAFRLIDASTGSSDWEDTFKGFRLKGSNVDEMTGIVTVTFEREVAE